MMNKTKIEWCDYTWNVVTGCLHGCKYCYARRIANRFAPLTSKKLIKDMLEIAKIDNVPPTLEHFYKAKPFEAGFYPTFYHHRLNEPQKVKKPSKIFVCSMGDLFGDWVPNEWIEAVIKVAKECHWHKFLFLTKNPKRYYAFDFPDNCWLGASAVNKPDEKVTEVDGGFLTTTAHCTADTMRFFKNSFISFEPLLNDVMQDCDLDGIDWVIVGAQTGPGAKTPKPEWVQHIINEARHYKIPIFLKDNLKWPEKIQEYPKRLEGKGAGCYDQT